MLPEWCRRLVQLLDAEAIAARIVDAGMQRAFPGQQGDTEFIETFRAGVVENTSTLQQFLSGWVRLEDIAPARPLKLAALQANLDISESAIQQSYRIGTHVMVSEWTHAVGQYANHESLATTEALAAVEDFTLKMMTFQDQVLRIVSAAHETELASLRASRVQMRRQILKELLRGGDVTGEAELSETLAYELGAVHVAVILSACPEPQSRRLTQNARAKVQASATITLPLGAAVTVVWLARPAAWTDRMLVDLAVALGADGATASIGQPGRGLSGFTGSFEEARRAEMVRAAWTDSAPTVLRFAEVQLEAMALADLGAARRFVAHELRGLMVDDTAAARLRETLLVWFETGSHVSTAAKLELHEHSVRNRLRRAEELIGHPLTNHRIELQVALRLYRIVSAGEPDPAGQIG